MNGQTAINRATAKQEVFEEYLVLYDFILGYRSSLDFAVIKVVGKTGDQPPMPLYECWEGHASSFTEDLSRASIFLKGSIKWDGCSDWEFEPDEGLAVHFCGQREATSIGRLMERMYDIAAAEMPSFDRHMARMPPLIEGAQ